jgi:hypothetical protein
VTTLYAQVEPEEASGPKACSFGPASSSGASAALVAIFGLSLLRRRSGF